MQNQCRTLLLAVPLEATKRKRQNTEAHTNSPETQANTQKKLRTNTLTDHSECSRICWWICSLVVSRVQKNWEKRSCRRRVNMSNNSLRFPGKCPKRSGHVLDILCGVFLQTKSGKIQQMCLKNKLGSFQPGFPRKSCKNLPLPDSAGYPPPKPLRWNLLGWFSDDFKHVCKSPPLPRGECFRFVLIVGDGFRRISKLQNPHLYHGTKVFVACCNFKLTSKLTFGDGCRRVSKMQNPHLYHGAKVCVCLSYHGKLT